MIIARLTPSEHEGRRMLTGVLQNTDEIRDGSMVVLKRMPDGEYHLRAITGFPSCKDPAQGASYRKRRGTTILRFDSVRLTKGFKHHVISRERSEMKTNGSLTLGEFRRITAELPDDTDIVCCGAQAAVVFGGERSVNIDDRDRPDEWHLILWRIDPEDEAEARAIAEQKERWKSQPDGGFSEVFR